MPKQTLAKNFGVDAGAFDGIPDSELYIFQAAVPRPLQTEAVANPNGTRQDMKFSLLEQPARTFRGGRVRIADAGNFPISTKIAAALVEVEPGHLRVGSDVSLAQWLAMTLHKLVQDHLHLDKTLIDSIRTGKESVF